jgi:rhomboid protease GluP
MIANFLVFVIMVISGVSIMEPTVSDLIKWGGNLRSLVVEGEWYRLITNTFVHAGIIHILFNMYALFYIGRFLEPLIGRWRFLILYLCTGIFASATSIWWSGDRVSVGASGAIFGMYGVFLALLTTNLIDKNVRKGMLQSIGIFVVYNLAYGMKGGIDNAAHVGGLISGSVLGYLTYLFFMKKSDNKVLSNIVVSIITLIGAFTLLSSIQDDTAKFQKDFSRFAAPEDTALSPLKNVDSSTSTAEFVDQLKNISKPAWAQSKQIFEQTKNYRLNDFLQERRKKFEEYIDLRMLQTDLLIARNTEDDPSYDKRIDSVSNKINTIIDSLNKE